MKTCCSCKQEKAFDQFHRRGKGYTCWCKTCRKEYDKLYHQRNKPKILQQKKDRLLNIKEYMRETKSKLSCIQCGENHPACLDFHHRNKNEKDYEVGYMAARKYSIAHIEIEIAKCDVLCSNCHRKLHWNERQNGN